MSHHTGMLYLEDGYGNPVEVVNPYRTASAAAAACSTVSISGDVDVFALHPCTMASDGSVAEWAVVDPDRTAAPWYDGSAASLEAVGLFITDWTGLDGAHHRRALSDRGLILGGGTWGRQWSASRTMAVNVALIGLSARGLNHLFRWLESTLLASCDPCETGTIWTFERPPDSPAAADLEAALVRIPQVGLVEGPTWVEADLSAADGAVVRVASFTLAAGDPCLRHLSSLTSSAAYGRPTAGTGSSPAGCAQFVGAAGTLQFTMEAPAYGWAAPIITIAHGFEAAGSYVPAMRISGFADPADSGLVRPCSQTMTGFIVLDGVQSGDEVVVDCGSLDVRYRNRYTGEPWQDGSRYIAVDHSLYGSGARRRIATVGCSTTHVIVEPAISNLHSLVGGITAAESWSITAQTIVRVGCA